MHVSESVRIWVKAESRWIQSKIIIRYSLLNSNAFFVAIFAAKTDRCSSHIASHATVCRVVRRQYVGIHGKFWIAVAKLITHDYFECIFSARILSSLSHESGLRGVRTGHMSSQSSIRHNVIDTMSEIARHSMHGLRHIIKPIIITDCVLTAYRGRMRSSSEALPCRSLAFAFSNLYCIHTIYIIIQSI